MAMTTFAPFLELLRAKAADPGARAATYVALGDSVTQGCMQHQVYEYELIYHQVCKRYLQQHFPGTVLHTINAGVGGDTAMRSLDRWERDVAAFRPDLITILFGHNDAHGGAAGVDDYIEAIDTQVRLAARDTEAAVLLITPCMMMKRDNARIADAHRELVPAFVRLAEDGVLEQYVSALRTYASSRSLALLDAYAMWEEMEARGLDIHDRLSNGINHPDGLFHLELGQRLYGRLLA